MERGFDSRRLHQFPFITPVPGRGLWLDLFVRDIVKKGAEVCSRIDSNCWILFFYLVKTKKSIQYNVVLDYSCFDMI